ncbi:MAG: squalene/phytoene synthase family protein [Gammaproteobacteria bacterium]|nr:squalene/phytoene synthase family protein [Gammaproteobacteria bacterium]
MAEPGGRALEEARSPRPDRAVDYQERALLRVSRTFALTIPQLPRRLRRVIGNAYLLCRIADTIEDEPALSRPQKQRLLGEFAQAVAGSAPAGAFVARLGPMLSDATGPDEWDLATHAGLLLDLTHGFRPAQRAAIDRCIGIMTKGMAEFGGSAPGGLGTLRDLERYTYCVAGVVGEMITDLLCEDSTEIAARRDRLRPLSARFGCGLQLVNILKDFHADQRRGACWLPRAAFADGVDLSSPEVRRQAAFLEGQTGLVAVAVEHLKAALEYTLLIPPGHAGVRRFLLWTLGLAALTLRRIHANPRFAPGDAVKAPRPYVWAMVVVTGAAARWDAVLRWLFRNATARLPQAR